MIHSMKAKQIHLTGAKNMVSNFRFHILQKKNTLEAEAAYWKRFSG